MVSGQGNGLRRHKPRDIKTDTGEAGNRTETYYGVQRTEVQCFMYDRQCMYCAGMKKGWGVQASLLLRRREPFMRRIPSAPNIRIPKYCNPLAMPKKVAHNTPFAVADMGSSICAKEKM